MSGNRMIVMPRSRERCQVYNQFVSIIYNNQYPCYFDYWDVTVTVTISVQ